ncbi:hypothetical protein [Pseudonocardia sp.]|jgi:hypothetical protein|uniref:hypothetical protein n=1 Tax=Pseudonocardia sp. TaxID=60912 RepID=UPI00260A2BC6|nr:hypothetical protein [Pseudonocardia sp.]MCW2716771.1 hypothetical protein [Pseudonocardia sp.]MDT7618253.1 hypothetical protein [Pseudonocardiales bacterium]
MPNRENDTARPPEDSFHSHETVDDMAAEAEDEHHDGDEHEGADGPPSEPPVP